MPARITRIGWDAGNQRVPYTVDNGGEAAPVTVTVTQGIYTSSYTVNPNTVFNTVFRVFDPVHWGYTVTITLTQGGVEVDRKIQVIPFTPTVVGPPPVEPPKFIEPVLEPPVEFVVPIGPVIYEPVIGPKPPPVEPVVVEPPIKLDGLIPTCMDGYVWDPVLQDCVRDPGFMCPPGFEWDPIASFCRRVEPPPVEPPPKLPVPPEPPGPPLEPPAVGVSLLDAAAPILGFLLLVSLIAGFGEMFR